MMDGWCLFDLASRSLPSFYSGRVLVLSDAIAPSQPRYSFCMKVVAVLSSLLEEPRGHSDPNRPSIESLFAASDASCRERD
ncbi:hypothetical protein N657DRAFT_368029 [Parathielavia appendiculata]|uniref:Uncharacterized protein n=1 Tax=Parathielavia appendiculata TaxID=2587402 RepID=A0AAN6TRC7_9PEZI|nr:hypothetical protein N657DRAFT_368029 [Parathielavia appendiculata]